MGPSPKIYQANLSFLQNTARSSEALQNPKMGL